MVASVLVVVDEDMPGVAVLAPPGRRRVSRQPPLHLAGEGEGRPADVAELPLGHDPDVDVQPVAPRSLRETDDAQLVKHLADDPGDDAHPVEPGLGHGVEVDPPLVGAIDIGAPDVPRMELHGRHLHRPDDRPELGDAQFVGGAVPAGEVQPHGLQPRRGPVRDPLLVDLLAGQPLGEPVQHARPLPQRPDDAVADREVVVRQVEFGPPVLREIHPVGVAEPDRPLTDGELDRGGRCLRGHHRTLSGMPRPRHTVA